MRSLIEQGYEMGRPSLIRLAMTLRDGKLDRGLDRRRRGDRDARHDRGMTILAARRRATIVHLERLELALRAAAVARSRMSVATRSTATLRMLRQATPELWNGRMLLLAEHAIERAVFRGSFLETDFASFVAWRDWGFPEAGVLNCFAMGALRASDGAYLLGVMGPQTVNAGKIYFPAGVPDLDDIVGDRVDLARNVRREMVGGDRASAPTTTRPPITGCACAPVLASP